MLAEKKPVLSMSVRFQLSVCRFQFTRRWSVLGSNALLSSV